MEKMRTQKLLTLVLEIFVLLFLVFKVKNVHFKNFFRKHPVQRHFESLAVIQRIRSEYEDDDNNS